MTAPEIPAQVIEHARISTGQRVLEPSAGKAALASAARNAGADVTCVELQPGFAHELRVIHGFADAIEGDFLALDPAHYAQFDAVIMNPPFDRGRDCDHLRHALASQFGRATSELQSLMRHLYAYFHCKKNTYS